MSLPDAATVSYQMRNDYLQGGLVECFLNGIYVVIVSLTFYASVSKRGWHASLRPAIGVMLIMYFIATIHLIQHWILLKFAFISTGQTEATIFASLAESIPFWAIVVGKVPLAINMIIADCVLIWRCWITWYRNWKIIVLPALLLVVETVTGVLDIVFAVKPTHLPPSSSSAVVTMPIIHTAVSLATTLVATLLIIYRIMSIGGHKFQAVIEIIVESAALYSIALIIYMGFTVSPKFSDLLPATVLNQVTGIAPTLMIARITFSMARPDSSWNAPLSTLNFFDSTASPSFRNTLNVTTSETYNLNINRPDAQRIDMDKSRHMQV